VFPPATASEPCCAPAIRPEPRSHPIGAAPSAAPRWSRPPRSCHPPTPTFRARSPQPPTEPR
jgi:hypothetical protein